MPISSVTKECQKIYKIKHNRELVKNSQKDSNCKNFTEIVESNHKIGSTIYFVIMTITSSGDNYILEQMQIMFIVMSLNENPHLI